MLITISKRVALSFLIILMSGCSNLELVQRTIDDPVKGPYHGILLDISLSDENDTKYVATRFVIELEKRGLNVIQTRQLSDSMPMSRPGTALLKIQELDQQTETVVVRRSYGRASLTMMRGRELRDKPVITLRATLIDIPSGRAVFQADYVTRGPWYQDSSSLVATLANTLTKQLEQEGFIATK